MAHKQIVEMFKQKDEEIRYLKQVVKDQLSVIQALACKGQSGECVNRSISGASEKERSAIIEARTKVYQRALKKGIVALNDLREAEGLPRIEGGDLTYKSVNDK